MRRPFKPVHTLPALSWRAGSASPCEIVRATPEETAVGISYDSEPYAVLMATPADVADLAVGFTLTERIARPDDIVEIRVSERDEGLVADVLLSRAGVARARDRRQRNLEARSSCGLCGVQSPEDALRSLPVLPDGMTLTAGAIGVALEALEDQQRLGAETRATHAAAWSSPEGRILLVREDVGRHNALDKLIGAAVKARLDPGRAFIVVTSRCSYEMVEKTALAGVAMIAAISAPTALAVRKAKAANLTLVGIARQDGCMVFAGAHRLRSRDLGSLSNS